MAYLLLHNAVAMPKDFADQRFKHQIISGSSVEVRPFDITQTCNFGRATLLNYALLCYAALAYFRISCKVFGSGPGGCRLLGLSISAPQYFLLLLLLLLLFPFQKKEIRCLAELWSKAVGRCA